MLTRAIALETAGQGIRVFGFQPGTTDTDMQVLIRASGINPVSQIPRGNLTPVAHPAAAIVYLCTPAADDLNGQEFSLRDEAVPRAPEPGAADGAEPRSLRCTASGLSKLGRRWPGRWPVSSWPTWAPT